MLLLELKLDHLDIRAICILRFCFGFYKGLCEVILCLLAVTLACIFTVV